MSHFNTTQLEAVMCHSFETSAMNCQSRSALHLTSLEQGLEHLGRIDIFTPDTGIDTVAAQQQIRRISGPICKGGRHSIGVVDGHELVASRNQNPSVAGGVVQNSPIKSDH